MRTLALKKKFRFTSFSPFAYRHYHGKLRLDKEPHRAKRRLHRVSECTVRRHKQTNKTAVAQIHGSLLFKHSPIIPRNLLIRFTISQFTDSSFHTHSPSSELLSTYSFHLPLGLGSAALSGITRASKPIHSLPLYLTPSSFSFTMGGFAASGGAPTQGSLDQPSEFQEDILWDLEYDYYSISSDSGPSINFNGGDGDLTMAFSEPSIKNEAGFDEFSLDGRFWPGYTRIPGLTLLAQNSHLPISDPSQR